MSWRVIIRPVINQVKDIDSIFFQSGWKRGSRTYGITGTEGTTRDKGESHLGTQSCWTHIDFPLSKLTLHSSSIYPGITWLQRRKGQFWLTLYVFVLSTINTLHLHFLLLFWKGTHGDPGSAGPKGDKVWEKCCFYAPHHSIRLWIPLQKPLEVLIRLQSGKWDTVSLVFTFEADLINCLRARLNGH